MQTLYTEATLKPMKKAELYEILLTNGAEVNKDIGKDEMIAMILAKNPLADEPTKTSPDEPKADEGTNTPPDEENAADGEQGAKDGTQTPPADEPIADEGLPKYTPEQLIKSSTYSHRRDVLRALLDDDKTYSHADIKRILEKFYKKEVK